MWQPILLGGLFIGVLSSLPILSIGNACCCLWVVTGGLLTTYLQQQARETRVESTEAALGGLGAGAVGAIISGIVSVAIVGISGEAFEAQVREMLGSINLPPDVRERVDTAVTSRSFLLLSTLFSIPVYAAFGMLGSLLGLAVFRKKPPVSGNWG